MNVIRTVDYLTIWKTNIKMLQNWKREKLKQKTLCYDDCNDVDLHICEVAAHIPVRHISSSFSPRAMRYAADHYRNNDVSLHWNI